MHKICMGSRQFGAPGTSPYEYITYARVQHCSGPCCEHQDSDIRMDRSWPWLSCHLLPLLLFLSAPAQRLLQDT